MEETETGMVDVYEVFIEPALAAGGFYLIHLEQQGQARNMVKRPAMRVTGMVMAIIGVMGLIGFILHRLGAIP